MLRGRDKGEGRTEGEKMGDEKKRAGFQYDAEG